MRQLEHRLAWSRLRIRQGLARLGPRDPARTIPARLSLRLDEADLPFELGQGAVLTPAAWHRGIVAMVELAGPLPVTILAGGKAGAPIAAELVRFAHRLECPVTLVCDGRGVDFAKAAELIDRGLRNLRVLIGGVSAEVHQAVLHPSGDGASLDEATGAVTAAVAARADRKARLDIEVGLPWRGPAHAEARAVLGWARQAGADGFRLLPPWLAADVAVDPELLDSLADPSDPFQRTDAGTIAALHAAAAHADGKPGHARVHALGSRRHRPCPVGGLRLELSARGRLCCCPFLPPIADAIEPASQDLPEAWAQAGPHLAAIRACDRLCAHPELRS